MTNSISEIPCSECITLAACRALVDKYDMTDTVEVLKAISTISEKCSLIKPLIFEKQEIMYDTGETLEYSALNDQAGQNVILEILGIP